MSTDYGLKCLDCDKSIVQDNMRQYEANDALNAVIALAALKRAINDVSSYGCLSVDVSADWCTFGFDRFLDWIYKHYQHRLVVVDEYGKENPQS
jgi:hypothetical protein